MIRLHYEGDCNNAATGSQDTTLLCRGGQPVDNSTRRVLLDLVHTISTSVNCLVALQLERDQDKTWERSGWNPYSKTLEIEPSSLGEIRKTQWRDQNGIRILNPWKLRPPALERSGKRRGEIKIEFIF